MKISTPTPVEQADAIVLTLARRYFLFAQLPHDIVDDLRQLICLHLAMAQRDILCDVADQMREAIWESPLERPGDEDVFVDPFGAQE